MKSYYLLLYHRIASPPCIGQWAVYACTFFFGCIWLLLCYLFLTWVNGLCIVIISVLSVVPITISCLCIAIPFLNQLSLSCSLYDLIYNACSEKKEKAVQVGFRG